LHNFFAFILTEYRLLTSSKALWVILDIFALYEAKAKGDIKSYITALFKETSAINLKCEYVQPLIFCSLMRASPPDTMRTKNGVGIQNEKIGMCALL